MNLGIEYLIRTGAIRGFFETPSSLFVESKDKSTRMAICFKNTTGCSDLISIDHWHLNDDHQLPMRQFFRVKKSDLFTSPLVVIPNMNLIPFFEGPICSSLNEHNHPMPLDVYHDFYYNFLNSLKNKVYKKDWLWDCFAKVNLKATFVTNRMSLNIQERRFIIEHEMRHVRTKKPELWSFWNAWNQELLFEEQVSPELVFSTVYKSITKPDFSYRWVNSVFS